MSFNFRGKIRY